MSKFNKDKAREKECNNNHLQDRAVALAQMLHAMLKYPEVITDLQFLSVQTLPLELHPRVDRRKKEQLIMALTLVASLMSFVGGCVWNHGNNIHIQK
eukprot:13348667-Ditylum_brightwellii.AAC.1